jgi:hypothetical protein
MHHAHAGSDAYAYWYGVRAWLHGEDPYQISNQALPWHYPPWMLPVFVPWALVPWPIAWWLWQAAALIGMALTTAWAYRSRPMATAVAAVLLSVPIGIALDTGNVILFCAFALWVAQFRGPRVAGLLWAVVAAVKWFPAVFLFLLPPRARAWGLGFAAVAVVLSLLTWQWTVELITSVALTGVPHTDSLASLRLDHLAILWALIPWLWSLPDRRSRNTTDRPG